MRLEVSRHLLRAFGPASLAPEPPAGRRASPGPLVLVAFLAGGLGMTAPLAAQERQLSLESFAAAIEVQPDASILVQETLRVHFEGEWNGIERDLSLQHRTAEGHASRLRLRLESVTDEAGHPLKVDSRPALMARHLKIWVPGARDATRTVVIRYRVANALRFFDRTAADTSVLRLGPLRIPLRRRPPADYHDELYWNVTGNAWRAPIRTVTTNVSLPPGVTGVEAWAYTGAAGSREQAATVTVRDRRVLVRSSRPFEAGEGLTVSVTWPPGIVARPGQAAHAAGLAAYGWPLALPPVAFVLLFAAWWKTGRDPKRKAVAVQYEPPSGLSPAEVGTLIDNRAENHDITATLVDLAVRGYLLIEEREEKKLLGLMHSTEYYFHQKRPPGDWASLGAHERTYLAALFSETGARRWEKNRMAPGAGPALPPDFASVKLSDLKNNFYRHLAAIRNDIYDQLRGRGFYRRRPDRVQSGWVAAAVLLLVLGFAGANYAAGGVPLAGAAPLLAGSIVTALIMAGFSRIMPARTESGARAREAALGFKEFLERVEEPRYRRLITSPALFEKYLPYALAFGVEERWAAAFQDMLQVQPDWYSGSSPTGFNAASFTHSVSSLSSQASSSMSSSPSGSGGGGSSGGGSGGGGGGGF